MTTITTERMMTKDEAQQCDSEITKGTDDWFHTVGPKMIAMREREGFRALGFKTFGDYCKHLDKRFDHRHTVKRLIDRTEVEANLQRPVVAQHAYALAKLPTADAQRYVYAQVLMKFENPTEQNIETQVDKWFRENAPHAKRGRRDDKEGWTTGDLEDDEELSKALDRVEEVYSRADRRAIQDGTIGLSRKDIIGLSKFHASKMREVQYLIMVNHWDLADSMKFINKSPDSDTTAGELHNYCLSTAGFFYTCSINGFDHTVKACKALTSKIKK